MRVQNLITPKIEQTINYRTSRLVRLFRLRPADKDNIRLELTPMASAYITPVAFAKFCIETGCCKENRKQETK